MGYTCRRWQSLAGCLSQLHDTSILNLNYIRRYRINGNNYAELGFPKWATMLATGATP